MSQYFLSGKVTFFFIYYVLNKVFVGKTHICLRIKRAWTKLK